MPLAREIVWLSIGALEGFMTENYLESHLQTTKLISKVRLCANERWKGAQRGRFF